MRRGIIAIIFLLLTACNTHAPIKGTAVDEMNSVMQQAVANNRIVMSSDHTQGRGTPVRALLPSLKIRDARSRGGPQRFDIAVKDVPAQAFYMGLVADTSTNMVVSPEIKGNVTLSLKRVTIEQVLQALEDAYGYSFNAIPGGYEILPNTLRTQIFKVNYLELERKSRSNMTVSSGEVTTAGTPGSPSTGTTASGGNLSGVLSNGNQNYSAVVGNVETKSNIDFWKSLENTVKRMIGKADDRSVTVNKVAGLVVVHATPRELKQVERYLDMTQNSMDRQVILEAKILEVNLTNEFQMGIDWKLFGTRLNALSNFPEVDISQASFPKAFDIDIHWNPQDFTSVIQALETQGNVQVLSSPRVSAMNNQSAAIKVGFDEFFVTNVSQNQNIVTSSLVTQPTLNVNLTPFFSGITLDVTPQIDANGQVTLHIHPTVSLVKDQRKVIDLGTQGGILDLPLANSTIRESDTMVHAKNGQVVVIGGLMQDTTTEGIAQLPWFGNIPFLGTLVRATKQNSQKSELVILLRPTIVTGKSTNKDITVSARRVSSLKRGFHIGDRPDIYGTQGEVPIMLGPKSHENLGTR
ncbi:pilus (MSHA type) biogenesis protein MshL [Legionella sainthelensi]|uniref:Pilus (MSHA type) biogenesis protein MshL n=1 Tax=Legionella sainthelensi TaxID=28087 RepID=A0A2H5FK69_9GAMM|nr:pilus (MSHA type) biogenesis protein MshL [Legionella sainthelensi]AUH71961.1 pilus (MSHA type) biogenesis protein MshL [Legionella sainthelensi]